MPHVNKLPGILVLLPLNIPLENTLFRSRPFFGVSTLIPVWDQSVYAGLTARQTQC